MILKILDIDWGMYSFPGDDQDFEDGTLVRIITYQIYSWHIYIYIYIVNIEIKACWSKKISCNRYVCRTWSSSAVLLHKRIENMFQSIHLVGHCDKKTKLLTGCLKTKLWLLSSCFNTDGSRWSRESTFIKRY